MSEGGPSCAGRPTGEYIERLGGLPGPTVGDYADALRRHWVPVAERGSEIVGRIVLGVRDEGFLVDNGAVDPSRARVEPGGARPQSRRSSGAGGDST
jgi:hypothetical protein